MPNQNAISGNAFERRRQQDHLRAGAIFSAYTSGSQSIFDNIAFYNGPNPRLVFEQTKQGKKSVLKTSERESIGKWVTEGPKKISGVHVTVHIVAESGRVYSQKLGATMTRDLEERFGLLADQKQTQRRRKRVRDTLIAKLKENFVAGFHNARAANERPVLRTDSTGAEHPAFLYFTRGKSSDSAELHLHFIVGSREELSKLRQNYGKLVSAARRAKVETAVVVQHGNKPVSYSIDNPTDLVRFITHGANKEKGDEAVEKAYMGEDLRRTTAAHYMAIELAKTHKTVDSVLRTLADPNDPASYLNEHFDYGREVALKAVLGMRLSEQNYVLNKEGKIVKSSKATHKGFLAPANIKLSKRRGANNREVDVDTMPQKHRELFQEYARMGQRFIQQVVAGDTQLASELLKGSQAKVYVHEHTRRNAHVRAYFRNFPKRRHGR